MTTKEKIRKEALTLFSEKGYSAVSVGDIAHAVGIKAPSLYKHYKSKQDIFQGILDEMKASYDQQAAALHMDGSSPDCDAPLFAGLSEDALVEMAGRLFRYFLHDEAVQQFRKILTIEQFHDPALAGLYTKQYVDDPLAYQGQVFALLAAGGVVKAVQPSLMALQFYGPIYLLLTACDRQPDREADALQQVEEHVRQFCRLYQGGAK